MIERPEWAMILGGGEGVWDEARELEAMVGGGWPGLVIAVNNAGCEWGRRLDHWVSLHPEKFHGTDLDGTGNWIQARKEWGHPDGFVLWSRRAPELVDRIVKPWNGASSGRYALRVANELGVRKAVLCGVPMTKTPHYHLDRGGKPWIYADAHWLAWENQWHRIEGWVRSMSGRTRETLGAPDLRWLETGE